MSDSAAGRLRAWLPWCVPLLAVVAWLRSGSSWRLLDHCAYLACDFGIFHAQSEILLEKPTPLIQGWLYPPAAGLLFWPLGLMEVEPALVVWSLVNLGLALALAALCARELAGFATPTRWAVGLGLVAVSLPVLHSVKWGQISLLICVLSILGLRESRRAGLGGALLGGAAALKLYPAVYLVGPALQGRWKLLAVAAGSFLVLGFLVPLGPVGWWGTVGLLSTALRAGWHAGGESWESGRDTAWWGGQGLQQSLERWFVDGAHAGLPGVTGPLLLPLPALAIAGVALVSVLALLALGGARAKEDGARDARVAALTLTTTTLLMVPGWHHYFAFLPFAIAVVWGDALARPPAHVLASASFAIAALPALLLGGDPAAYYVYSDWGGTTLACATAWAALVWPRGVRGAADRAVA